jgi:hypothetical protein
MRELIATVYGPSWQVGRARRRIGPMEAIGQETAAPVAIGPPPGRVGPTLA